MRMMLSWMPTWAWLWVTTCRRSKFDYARPLPPSKPALQVKHGPAALCTLVSEGDLHSPQPVKPVEDLLQVC